MHPTDDIALDPKPGAVGNATTVARWIPPVLLTLVGAAMLAWTWGKWPDVLVDFGRELYVPWQITEGKVLYRDITSVQGPLSPYINALWFSVFGVSLRTLVLANLAILVGVTLLLYRLLVAIGERFAATVACVVFLGLFAFVQFGAIGNFNYVCPYRHEATHAMFLSLATLNCLAAYLRRPRSWLVVVAGACVGLLALTKGEFFAAIVLALAIPFVLALWINRPDGRFILRLSVLFAAAAIVPLLACLSLLTLAMPATEALRGVLGSWPATFHDAFRLSRFVQHGMGTEDVTASLKSIWHWTLNYSVLFAIASAVGLALRTRHWIRPAVSIGLVVFLLAKARTLSIHWSEVARPLPLFMLLFAVVTFARLLRRRADSPAPSVLLPALALTVFAGVLLGKMALNTRIHHYGFVLAMPAAMLVIIALVGWIPFWIDAKGGFGWAFRGVALTVLFALCQWYLNAARVRLLSKNVTIAERADSFLADQRGIVVNRILARLHESTVPDETLLVLPEGAMLNFLSRRADTLPFVDFVPTEFFFFGENRIMASIQAHPPDWIALVHNDTSEFGFRFFGQDYGLALFGWIQSHYREVTSAGSPPFVDEQFGIVLLHKIP